MQRQSLRFWPQTPWGMRSARLLVVSGLMLLGNIVFFSVADTSIADADWFRMSILPVYSIVFISTGVIGGVYAWLAIVRQQERALLTWACAVLGVLIVLFLLGEFVVPH